MPSEGAGEREQLRVRKGRPHSAHAFNPGCLQSRGLLAGPFMVGKCRLKPAECPEKGSPPPIA